MTTSTSPPLPKAGLFLRLGAAVDRVLSPVLRPVRVARFLDVKAIAAESRAEVAAVALRHDVPIGPHVPPDLADTQGRMLTADGYRISGRLQSHMQDVGFQSPTIPVLMAIVPILALVSTFHPILFVLTLPVVAVLLGAINHSADKSATLSTVFLGYLLPLVAIGSGFITALADTAGGMGMTLPGLVKGMFSERGLGGLSPQDMLGIATFAVYPIAAILAVAVVVWLATWRRGAAGRFVKVALTMYALALACIVVLPPSVTPVFFALLGCWPALSYSRRYELNHALRLNDQGTATAAAGNTGALVNAHKKARAAQVEAAIKDTSPFIRYGTAQGKFTALHDNLAPDPGLPFGQTLNDIKQTNLVIVGEIGSGKSSGVVRRVLADAIRHGIGLVVMCGKGALQAEGEGVPGYTLIKPGMALALIEGLSPSDVAVTLAGLHGDVSSRDGGSGEAGKFFVTTGQSLVNHICVLLEQARIAQKVREAETGQPRYWQWSLWHVMELGALLQADPEAKEGEKKIDEVERLLTDYQREAHARTELALAAIDYFRVSWATLDIKTRSNVWATVQSWVSGLMQNEKLLPWTRLETGYDVTAVCQGEKLGIAVPAIEFGEAGRLVQMLVKKRIQVEIGRRKGSTWKQDPANTHVLFVIDEAHTLLSRDDVEFASMSREWGGHFCIAFQAYESLEERMGDVKTRALMAQFLSAIVFHSTEKSYQWLAGRLGEIEAWTPSVKTRSLDYRSTRDLFLSSPLNDPSHPKRRWMKTLQRQGLGYVDERKATMGGKDLLNHGVRQGVGGKEYLDDHDFARMNIAPVTGGKYEYRPLLSKSEWSAYTPRFHAVASVERAGLTRRDVIETTPAWSIRELLTDEDLARCEAQAKERKEKRAAWLKAKQEAAAAEQNRAA